MFYIPFIFCKYIRRECLRKITVKKKLGIYIFNCRSCTWQRIKRHSLTIPLFQKYFFILLIGHSFTWSYSDPYLPLVSDRRKQRGLNFNHRHWSISQIYFLYNHRWLRLNVSICSNP